MFRSILCTLLLGISNLRPIPRALLLPAPLFVCFCKAVATSSAAATKTNFRILPGTTSNEPVSSKFFGHFLVVVDGHWAEFGVF
ncbi:hypothetical protein TNCV_1526751 [Trichonephila clavipes]|nr:hypothetical protein TNCV_1526751 [Trichonephila clavipes]